MSSVRRHGAQFSLALLLALTLWSYVSFTTNPTSTRILTTAIEPTGISDDLVLVDNSTGLPEPAPQNTTLTLAGPREELTDVSSDDVHARVDLTGLGSGVNQVPVNVTIDQNGTVRVSELRPPEITVRLSRKLVATVPVSVTREGQPPFSFSAGQLTPSAVEAVASGPEELVRQVVVARTVIDLQGRTRDVEETLTLRAVNSDGDLVRGVTLTPNRVRVTIPIVAQVDVQQISVVPAIDGQPAPGCSVGSIDWDPKIVQVFTSGNITRTLSTDKVNISGATEDVTQTVSLSQPGNVITRPDNVQVTVRVSIIPLAVPSQLPLIVPITPVGLGKRYEAVANPRYVQITLAGLLDRLTNITADQLPATVDLSGYGPGTYTLPVQVDPPEGLQAVASSDPTVRITISERVATPTLEPESTTVATPTEDPTVGP